MHGLENPDRAKNQSVSRICYQARLEKKIKIVILLFMNV